MNKSVKLFSAVVILCAGMVLCHAQEKSPLTEGLDAYARADWPAAVSFFSEAVKNNPDSAEPWYWLMMTEISSGETEKAIADIDRFILSFSEDKRAADVLYQKGRLLFLTKSYDEAIQTLHSFINSYPEHKMIPSAYFWIGETLYACGRYEEAKNVYVYLTDTWPQSVKREASIYRIALIDQASNVDTLLSLLKISHEEALRIVEDYQRRERTYEQAVTSYQKRISDMMKDTRLADLESSLTEEKRRNAELLNEAAKLEAQNADLLSALVVAGVPIPESARTEENANLESRNLEIRNQALEDLKKRAERARVIYGAGNGDSK